MHRLILAFGAVLMAVATLATALPAGAESRLFTVATDQPSVSVVRAVYNGVDLTVAGRNGNATFFRIDNPAGAVPCAVRLVLVTSTGQTFDTPVDLCASNWEVTVRLAGGAPAVPSPGGQPVVIAVDDPSVTITEVFFRGRSVPIDARQGAYVRVLAPASNLGLECERDLGLALSDGRRIARLVDICRSNFLVVVPLAGGPRPPAPPASFLPAPLPGMPQPAPQPLPQPLPQPAPAQPVPLPQPVPSQPEFVDQMVWMFNPAGDTAALSFGIPNSDAGEFSAVCRAGSNQMTVTLDRAPLALTPGRQVGVTLTAGPLVRAYTATGGPVSELSGHANPVIQIAATDPLWAALARERVLSIAIDQVAPYGLSLRGSAVNVRPFLAFCSQPVVQQPTQPQAPGPSANVVGFRCNDGSFLSIAFERDTAMVNEPGYPPVIVLRTDSQGGARYVGGGSELIGLAEQVLWSRPGVPPRTCLRN